MSGSWASKRNGFVIVAALAATSAIAAPLLARALPIARISTHVRERSTHRIVIDGHDVTVTRAGADSASDSDRVTMPGDVDLGGISVHGGENGIVRLFSDAYVPAGQRVDGDVVAVFGSVTVEGEVEGAAVAVFGSLDLRRGALVHDDAVAVGGALREGDGSKVEGQTVQVGFLPLTLGLPGLPVVLSMIALAWLVSLFFAWMSAALFPARLARVAVTSSRRTLASLLLGIVSGPLVCMATLLLLVTVVGIPIAALLPFVYVAVLYAGQLAATYVLGCKLTRRRLGVGGPTAPLVSGSLLVASIFGFGAILWETPGIVRTVALFFLMVGGLLMVGLTTIGTGAFLLSRAGSRPADIDGLAPGDTPAPAPAVDPTAPLSAER
jgi:hypothetical protein